MLKISYYYSIRKLINLLIFSASIGFLVTFLMPSPANADSPVCETRTLTYTFATEAETDDFTGHKCWDGSQLAVKTGSGNGSTTPECYANPFGDGRPVNQLHISKDTILTRLGVLTDIISLNVAGRFTTYNNAFRASTINVYSDTTVINSDSWSSEWDYDHTISLTGLGSDFSYIEFYQYFNNYTNPGAYGFIDDLEFDVEACYNSEAIALSCSTVDNFHFTGDYTDTWQLSTGAVVSDSILTLPELEYARQNLTLQANKTYNAVISVTNVTTDTDFYLKMSLGSTYQTLTITQTGLYTATLSTPASLVGPIEYKLLNDPLEEYIPLFDPEIQIDWTCLSLDSDANAECIAPTNGEFSSANYWTWYRGASLDSLNHDAYLPYDTKGLIISTLTYSMPVITTGQYLILKFDAQSPGTGGIVGARAQNITNTVDYLADTYPAWYTYQMPMQYFSGLSDVSISFANPGIGGCPGYTSTNHVSVDNVCLYISDTAPQLPFASDPDAPVFIDLGFNYTSCADIDAIYSGFGVNMAQYRATYAAGVSFWDPAGWVPWVVAAVFVQLANWSCLYWYTFCWLVSAFEYLLNQIINIFDWLYRTVGDLIDYIPYILQILWGFLITYFFNLNGFRVLLNILIAAWNAFLSGLGITATWLFDTLLVWPWNNVIIPFLQKVWDYLSTVNLIVVLASIFLGFLWSLWNLIYILFWFIWNNIIGVVLLPVDFFWAFYNGISDPGFAQPFTCTGTNFWCVFFAGIELINLSVSHSVIYPIFIGGIIFTTLIVLWINIKELYSINIK